MIDLTEDEVPTESIQEIQKMYEHNEKSSWEDSFKVEWTSGSREVRNDMTNYIMTGVKRWMRETLFCSENRPTKRRMLSVGENGHEAGICTKVSQVEVVGDLGCVVGGNSSTEISGEGE